MTKTTTNINKGTAVSSTRGRSAKKSNDKAAEALLQLMEREKEKKAREEKKKKRAEEKKAEEEAKKKSDAEKVASRASTISPISTVADIATATGEMTIATDLDVDNGDNTTVHGINPNQLSYEVTSYSNESESVDEVPTEANSPLKKKTRGTSAVKAVSRYTTKSFSIAHTHAFPRTFVEAAVTLTKDDKPKEFIVAVKLLLTNGKILDPHFALAPLKPDTTTKKRKLISSEDDLPVNFTHLGQYAFTSGSRIFEKKNPNWRRGLYCEDKPPR